LNESAMGCSNGKTVGEATTPAEAKPAEAKPAGAKPAEANTLLTPKPEGDKPEETAKPPEETPKEEQKETIEQGTKVTLVDGREGTVIKSTAADVTLAIDKEGDKIEETVSMDKVYKLVVELVGARGLRNADTCGKSDPYASVEIDGVPASKRTTKVINETLEPNWNETFELFGYTPGSKLNFVVGDRDPLKCDDILGKVVLEDSEFKNVVFDKEVSLPEAEAKKEGAFLKVKVQLLPGPPPETEPKTKIEGLPGSPSDSESKTKIEGDEAKIAPKKGGICC